MERITATLLGLLLLANALAQSISLNGVVVIQNSQYETGKRIHVQDAGIRAPMAKSVISDKDGLFVLEFVGAPNGSVVEIGVIKAGHEVVNTNDLRQVVLGSIPMIQVVMAETGKLAEAKAKFYRISVDAMEESYQKRMNTLRDESIDIEQRLASVNEEHDSKTASLYEAIALLTDERERAMLKAEELAALFSRTDLDNASGLFISAFQHIERGRMDSALAVLDRERLDSDYAKAMAGRQRAAQKISDADAAIRSVHDSYGLKGNVLKAGLSYKQCLAVYQCMLTIQQEQADLFTPVDGADLHADIAALRLLMGDYAGVVEAIDRTVELRRQALGNDHPRVLEALALKGEALTELGLLDSAQVLIGNGLATAQHLDMPENKLLADLHSDMGVVLSLKGDLAGALAQHQISLDMRERLYGRMHPDVATCLNNLAQIKYKKGEYAAAKEHFAEALSIMQATLPEAHPLVASVHLNMAATASALGDFDGAIEEYGLASRLLARTLGDGHPLLGIIANNLGDVYMKKGEYQQALDQNAIGMVVFEKVLGPTHPNVGVAKMNRAAYLERIGEYPAALAADKQALVILTGALGPDHVNCGTVHNNMARLYDLTGVTDTSIVEYDEALRIYAKALGPGHPNIALVRNNLGLLLARLQRYPEALQQVDSAIVISTKALGAEHGQTYKLIANRYLILSNKGDHSEALAGFDGVLPMVEKAFGSDNPELAEFLWYQGNSAYALGDTAKAATVLLASYRITPAARTSWLMYRIALDTGHKEQALDHLVHCVSARRDDPKARPVDRMESMDALAALAKELGRPDILKEFSLE
jgi:tetratricopeptide (TPR) repeat protein